MRARARARARGRVRVRVRVRVVLAARLGLEVLQHRLGQLVPRAPRLAVEGLEVLAVLEQG